MKDARLKKRTLRTHVVRLMPVPRITPKQILELRKSPNLSRGVFARYLRTNVRTLEDWEQGRARPKAQAALLMILVMNFRIRSTGWRPSR